MQELFAWNGDYGDKEQVRPYLARYTELRGEGLSYNDDFRGKIPGVAGSPDEDTAIYMLSCLLRIERERERVAAALADGFSEIESGEAGSRDRFGEILVYRPDHYVGGTGQFTEYADARLMYDAGGKPMGVFPKRKQIGHDVTGARVFAR